MEKDKIKNLVLCIVSEIEGSGNKISLLKLINLIYLFDVEYYQVNRETYTKLDWVYGPIGPYSKELGLLLQELLESGELKKFSIDKTEQEDIIPAK